MGGLAVLAQAGGAGGLPLGSSAEVQVGGAPVAVLRLEMGLVESVSVTAPSGSLDGLAEHTAEIQIEQALTQEFQQAYVYVAAVLADGQRLVLDQQDGGAGQAGLSLVSLNSAVVEVLGSGQPQLVQALDSGSGLLVTGRLDSGSCSNSSVAVGFAAVEVALPPADGAVVDNFASKLTLVGDAAQLVSGGLATSSGVRVRLRFGTRFQDLSQDGRTVFNTSLANGLFSVSRAGDGTPTIHSNSQGQSGTGTLLVSFTHQTVTAQVQIQIVVATAVLVDVQPFPIYTGSSSLVVARLAPIAGTSPTLFQEGLVRVRMQRSDGVTVDVSTDGVTSDEYWSLCGGQRRHGGREQHYEPSGVLAAR